MTCIQVQPCCPAGNVGIDCNVCSAGTTMAELLLTVPAGTFGWSGFNCPGGAVPNCNGWLTGTFLLEQTAACFWPYAPPVAGPCGNFPILTCFTGISYLWSAGLAQRSVGGIPHAILSVTLDCHVITTTQCLSVEQGYWELDLGGTPLTCLSELATARTLALIRRSTSRCFPAAASTVQLQATA